jgi:hypothetical protein
MLAGMLRSGVAPMDAGGAIGQTSPGISLFEDIHMRLSRLSFVALLFGLAVLSPWRVQAQGSPYSVIVPVNDVSDAQRDAAFVTALGQVLTRVAGGQDLRSNAGYGDAMKNAASLVRKYQYQRAATGLSLEVDFEPGTVRRLISTLGVASAGVKPPVLLLVQGADGKLFDQSSLGSLAATASARGTNVTYPDAANPPDATQAAAADAATLAAIDQQYHTGLVLVGSLHNGSASWTLISGGQAQKWTNKGTTEDSLLSDAGNGMVDRIGKQLNVIGAGVSEGKVWVGGLKSAMDYADLLSALRADPSISDVSTIGAQNDGVLLDVKASVPLSALAANLAAGGRLLLDKDAHDGADATLSWLH